MNGDAKHDGDVRDTMEDNGGLSNDNQNEAYMQYRTLNTSLESNDTPDGQGDDYGGDMLDWDYDNVHWDENDGSQCFADSPLVEQVTQGVLQHTLDDTPVRTAKNDDMKVDSSRAASPDLIDLTNTPSTAQTKGARPEVIDLCYS